jgi:DNA invertase Pin-like site-specific DNA recombinase
LGEHDAAARPVDVDGAGQPGRVRARELIRVRTGEGRERAKARGVKLGRKPKLTLHQQREAIRRRDELGETLADIARTFNVSRSTISRLAA